LEKENKIIEKEVREFFMISHPDEGGIKKL